MKILSSKKFRLNLYDLIKGFIVAAVTAVLTGCGQLVENWISSGSLSIDKISLMIMAKTALVGGGAYLIKQFFTSPKLTISDEKENK
jgi:hypothetical protein